MKKIDQSINQYSLSKTLRFSLLPIGKTQENFEMKKLLEEDENRAKSYKKVKKYIDCYHKKYIEDILSLKNSLQGLNEYAELYYLSNKDTSVKDRMKKLEEQMRKEIAKAFTLDESYSLLWKKDLIKELLPNFLTDKEELDTVAEFKDFTTYFTGFFENRKNIYSDEEKSTSIAYRCINDNLPKFLDNAKNFEKINAAIHDKIELLNEDFCGIYDTKIEDIFTVDYFPFVLSQSEIDRYNNIIGGYTNSDGSKVQGLNEYINLYNQVHEKSEKIPFLKPLFKQILSDKESLSFIPESFENDNELLETIKNYFDKDLEKEPSKSISEILIELEKVFNDLESFDTNGIFVKTGVELTTVSNGVFGFYGAVKSAWEDEFDQKNQYKTEEKQEEARRKTFKEISSFSISQIQFYGSQKAIEENKNTKVINWIKSEIGEKIGTLNENYTALAPKLEVEYTANKKLCNNGEYIALIKNCLDAVKDLEKTIKLFFGTGKETGKDDIFYGEILPLYDRVSQIDKLYDKVRNYLTKKPYSKDKIKLNFQNPQFLGGWDRNKESDYSSVLLKKDNKYYLAIMDKSSRKVFETTPGCRNSESCYQKAVYKQIPNASKYISSKQILPQKPPEDIVKILAKKKADNKSLEKAEITRLIDYVINDFLPNYKPIIDNNGNSYFDFEFKQPNEYETFNEFCLDVERQAYSIKFIDIPELYIDTLVREGKVYLFQIYNKDFSSYSSKGTPNLHTMYFKALFDEINLKKGVIALNGGGEMFYRRKSINDAEKIIHPKNQPIKNKNIDNNKTESEFNYDIIKDKRFTVDKFMLHIPITLNNTAVGTERLNEPVRKSLRECDNNYVIGIDRGERNLIYICVIDGKGEIVEQISLNKIVNEYNGNTYSTDYHKLLDEREKDRLDARKNWTAVEGIKELKEGYISQVVHKICLLVEKYDAVIAMEDLNSGFKNTRSAVEKSVYQKFEKMLIDKLNFYANKNKNPEEIGGILNAYQLTNKFESFKKMRTQNGFIFYVPAWMTSKIDPTTGFVDLLKPRYESIDKSLDFFSKFDRISYNSDEDYFEFEFDYKNFPNGSTDFRGKWTVCTYGSRIETFRNKEKNSEWDNRTVALTDEFKIFFDKWNIDINADIKKQILSHNEKTFFIDLIHLLKLTLQMRNSITGGTEDYLISPVKNSNGEFYCSKDYENDEKPNLPKDADANGAYNIARKAQWAIEKIKSCDESEIKFVKIGITNKEWLEYVQKDN